MAKKRNVVEDEIMETVRRSSQPSDPSTVVKKVSNGSLDPRTTREVIRSLIDRGVLQVTVDWKLRASRPQE